LCLTPGTCDCRCHQVVHVSGVAQLAMCSGVASSGNECDLAAVYEFEAMSDGHRAYSCETHRDSVMRSVADAEGEFCVRRVGEAL